MRVDIHNLALGGCHVSSGVNWELGGWEPSWDVSVPRILLELLVVSLRQQVCLERQIPVASKLEAGPMSIFTGTESG